MYETIEMPYRPGKIVVSGANGRNGYATLLRLMSLPGVSELVGFVPESRFIDEVKDRLRGYEESLSSHSHPEVLITDDPEAGKHAQIWMNWKGVNLATLQKQRPDMEKEAKEKGIHLRDLLLETNLAIAIEDARNALKFAPNCIYIQQGNPVDVLARAVCKLLPGERVLSTGTMMEYNRWEKLVEREFPEISFERATGMFIGEHGELAVPVKERLLIGGLTAQEYIREVHGKAGLEKIEKIYSDVSNEAFWLREHIGATPSEGPSAVTSDFVQALLRPSRKSTIFGAIAYVNGVYGLKDICLSVPVAVNSEGARVLEVQFSKEVMTEFYRAVDHISTMNRAADKLMDKL